MKSNIQNTELDNNQLIWDWALKMKINLKLICFFLILLISSCATSIGSSFEKAANVNEYTIKIYTGLYGYEKVAAEKLKIKCEAFMLHNGYSTYEVVGSHYEVAPLSGVVFQVRFQE